jgi:lysophospholipase L1-like esterase
VSKSAIFLALACAFLVACNAPTQTQSPTVNISRPAPPAFGAFDPASTQGIDVASYPVLPEITAAIRDNVRATYQLGQSRGLNARNFAKLGDCMTENEFFMGPLAKAQFDLGEHAALKPTVEQFLGVPARANGGKAWAEDSFATVGLASAGGFNVAGPLDPTWSNPEWCQADESPLACELRVSKPAFAIVMFGTNDVNTTDLATYDYYLRTIISSTLDAGVVPILNTFPTRPENPDKSNQLNQIVVKVAQDYAVPLVNLNRALADLPNQGVDPDDTTHLSAPADGRVDVFTPENLRYGFTVRNLVTLQALDSVLKAVK